MDNSYCVYLTSYSGNKLPPFYIGSGTTKKLLNSKNPYKGSVTSIEYKTIWDSEIKKHPELFKTKIISYYDNRNEAYAKESKLQIQLNVIKNILYVNKCYALNRFKDQDSWHLKSGSIQREYQTSLVSNGTHRWLSGEEQRKTQKEMVSNGTHRFCDPNYQSIISKAGNAKNIENGSHNAIQIYICPHCAKEGKGIAMFRHHFERCKFKDTKC